MTEREKFDTYVTILKTTANVQSHRTEHKDEIAYAFVTDELNALAVTLTYTKPGSGHLAWVTLEVAGVDCGYWNTVEFDELDFFIEIAKSALKGTVVFQRSPIFKRQEGCFKITEGWACIPVSSIFTDWTIRKQLRKHPD